MALTTSVNFSGGNAFVYATDDDDQFDREHVALPGARLDDHTHGPGSGAAVVRLGDVAALTGFSTALLPTVSDGAAIGSTTKMWSDGFWAAGAVHNWNNGDVTLTHAANALTFAGATSGYRFNDGGIGIATAPAAHAALYHQAALTTTETTQYGMAMFPTFSTAATAAGIAASLQVATPNSAFTMSDAIGLQILNPNKGAASTITTAYGIYVAAITAGGTGNVGIFSASGIAIGSAVTNNMFDDASNGAGTTTMYIGNASINVTSDIRLKERLGPTEDSALDLFRKLDLFDYRWNDPSDTAEVNRNSRGVWRYGVSAQQLIDVMPWLVNAPDRECPTCRAGQQCEAHPSAWHVDFEYGFGALVAADLENDRRIARLEAALAGAGIPLPN